jgi:hypothetical protein
MRGMLAVDGPSGAAAASVLATRAGRTTPTRVFMRFWLLLVSGGLLCLPWGLGDGPLGGGGSVVAVRAPEQQAGDHGRHQRATRQPGDLAQAEGSAGKGSRLGA